MFKHEQPDISHCVSKCIYYWDYKKTVFISPVMLYKLYKFTSLWGKVAKQKKNKMIFLKASWALALLHYLMVAFTCSEHSKFIIDLSAIIKFSLWDLISLGIFVIRRDDGLFFGMFSGDCTDSSRCASQVFHKARTAEEDLQGPPSENQEERTPTWDEDLLSLPPILSMS